MIAYCFVAQVKPENAEAVMDPVFETLGLSYAFLKSAFEGEEDRFVPSGSSSRQDKLFKSLPKSQCGTIKR